MISIGIMKKIRNSDAVIPDLRDHDVMVMMLYSNPQEKCPLLRVVAPREGGHLLTSSTVPRTLNALTLTRNEFKLHYG